MSENMCVFEVGLICRKLPSGRVKLRVDQYTTFKVYVARCVTRDKIILYVPLKFYVTIRRCHIDYTIIIKAVPAEYLTSMYNCAYAASSTSPHMWLADITYSGLISYCFALHPYEKHGLIQPE